MLEILMCVAVGVLSGMVIGMMPGIGVGVFMAMIFPLLFGLDLDTLFLYFFSVMASTQYYGSIVATVFGIPGEISSVPAVRHGHPLFQTPDRHAVIMDTATASVIAAAMAVMLFWVLGHFFLEFFIYFLKGWAIVALLTLTMVMMIFTARLRWLAMALTLLGLLLGKVGLSTVLDARILTLGWTQLDSGIPMFPLLCGLIVIPILLEFEWHRRPLPVTEIPGIGLVGRFDLARRFRHWSSTLRGAVIGFVVGLIPGASYMVSSAVADNIEGRVSGPDSSRRQLMAAESANNAGAISALIPLIILGVPILLSEAIVLGVAESRGFNYNTSRAFFENSIETLMLGLIAVSVINWFLAGVFYNTVLWVYRRVYHLAYRVIMLACLAGMLYSAWSVMILELSMVVFFLALVTGLIIKDTQAKFCLIIAYFISSLYIDEIYRILLTQGLIS